MAQAGSKACSIKEARSSSSSVCPVIISYVEGNVVWRETGRPDSRSWPGPSPARAVSDQASFPPTAPGVTGVGKEGGALLIWKSECAYWQRRPCMWCLRLSAPYLRFNSQKVSAFDLLCFDFDCESNTVGSLLPSMVLCIFQVASFQIKYCS